MDLQEEKRKKPNFEYERKKCMEDALLLPMTHTHIRFHHFHLRVIFLLLATNSFFSLDVIFAQKKHNWVIFLTTEQKILSFPHFEVGNFYSPLPRIDNT